MSHNDPYTMLKAKDMNPLAAVAQLQELNALYEQEHRWPEVVEDHVSLMPVSEEHEDEDDEGEAGI
jgi:hypothetical protein